MTIDEALRQAIEHHKAGQLTEAERFYRLILEADPVNPLANHYLGMLAGQVGHAEAGLPYLEAAIRASGDNPAFHAGLGTTLIALGRPEAALACFQRAVELRPDWPEAHVNLAEAHSTLGQQEEAAAAYDRAVTLRPDYAEAHSNMGGILRDLGRFEDSLAHCETALALRPDMAAANFNMALTLHNVGFHDSSIACYNRALEQEPGLIRAHTSILTAILYHAGWTPEMLFAEHQCFEERHARPHYPARVAFANSRDPGRRLRIGFLSSDLWHHPVGRNLIPLVEAFDKSRLELFFYANVLNPDTMTGRFRAQAAGWRSILTLDDDAAAEVIRADRIDILVSLAGRFDLNRPQICARRPAPVMISFHDPATSGMEVMDAIIADRVLVPRHGEERFTERPIRLPSFYLHDPIDDAPPPASPPLLKNGFVTFGSFNNPSKLSEGTLALWAEVLHAVPESRLRLKYREWIATPPLTRRITGIMADHGIGPERLQLLGSGDDTAAHLALYHDIDIALDPFPFNGSTTTFEALWMGVPVVTLPQAVMVGRWTASILAALKLDELIAASPEHYVDICAALAADPDRLGRLRAGLRPRLAGSALCNPRLRARQVERAYRALWRQWCDRHDR